MLRTPHREEWIGTGSVQGEIGVDARHMSAEERGVYNFQRMVRALFPNTLHVQAG